MADTPRQKLTKRWTQLERERSSYISHYRDLQEYLLPRRGRFLTTERNDGGKKHKRILDNSGTLAARTLASGMMAGLTSPARPWFKLATPDPDLAEFGPVKEWLYRVERLLREVLARSNLYNVLHTTYKEIGVFGTSPFFTAENFKDVIRGFPITVGSYALDINGNLETDTLYREVPMTVKMVVDQFGKSRVSHSTLNMFNEGNLANNVTVMHAIEPNTTDLGYDGIESRIVENKPFRSVYWEKKGDSDRDSGLLELRGYREFPVLAPRWDVTGTDVYGSSPGMEALGDVQQLQVMQRWKGEGISKQVRPPMIAPEALRYKQKSTIPGGVTYYDGAAGMKGFEPAYNVRFELQYLIEDIRETKARISRAFYEDLFLMLAQSDRRQITAREIEERHEEKLLMLGPVLERLEDELLDPLIARLFSVCHEAGILPPPPQEIVDAGELKVEYISILAQAQKSVAINALERTATYVGGLAQVQVAGGGRADVIDKMDFDQMVDEYGDAIGIAPTVIRTDDDVKGIRDSRVKAEQQQQQMAMAQQAADAAAKAGTVKTDERNVVADAIQSANTASGGGNPVPNVGQP